MRDGDVKLPSYTHEPQAQAARGRRRLSRGLRVVLATAFLVLSLQYLRLYSSALGSSESVQVPLRAAEWLDKCQRLNVKPGPPPDFNTRTQSDRFVPGTRATLITVSLCPRSEAAHNCRTEEPLHEVLTSRRLCHVIVLWLAMHDVGALLVAVRG